MITPLGASQGMHLIDDDTRQTREHHWRIGQAEQQCQAFRCRQQQVGRAGALAATLFAAGVPGPGRDGDGQVHLCDRDFQVTRDIRSQRLQRADIQRVQPHMTGGVQVDQAGQETGQRLAATGRGDQQRVVTGPRGIQHRKLMPTRRPAARSEPAGKGFR